MSSLSNNILENKNKTTHSSSVGNYFSVSHLDKNDNSIKNNDIDELSRVRQRNANKKTASNTMELDALKQIIEHYIATAESIENQKQHQHQQLKLKQQQQINILLESTVDQSEQISISNGN